MFQARIKAKPLVRSTPPQFPPNKNAPRPAQETNVPNFMRPQQQQTQFPPMMPQLSPQFSPQAQVPQSVPVRLFLHFELLRKNFNYDQRVDLNPIC